VSEAASAPAALPQRRALVPVFVTVLLDLIGFGMILPLLPFYAQEYEATPALIGWLFGSYSLAQLVFAPLLGRLSDRVGRRPVLLGSIAGGILAYLLFANARTYGMLLLARSLAGVAAANYSIAQAYVADVTPPKDRSRAMGMVVGAAFGLGFILGPALGGFIAHFSGHRAVPFTAAALGAVNLILAMVWLRESLPPEVRGRSTGESWLDPRGIAAVWRDAQVRGLILLFFLVTFCFSMMETTLALFCQARFDFGVAETSWLFVFIGAILVGVQGGAVGPLVRRFGERRLILAGIVLMGAGLLLLPWATLWWLILPALALLAVGAGVHSPSSLGLLSLLTDEGTQGGTSGVYRSFGALARTLGPLAGPWLFGAVGIAWPFWAAGVLMLAALFPARLLLRRIDAG
jgi:MFS transporter, DHA1 family, tetracycline resistance protein